MDVFTLVKDFSLAFFIAFGFSFLFNTPIRSVWVAGLLGGTGHVIRFFLVYNGIGLIPATLVGAVVIGLIAIVFAHLVNTPPVVFSMPACITMIPGLYAYRSMLGLIKIAEPGRVYQEPHLISETAHNLMLSASLLFTLAIGISVIVLLFRKKSAKEFDVKAWFRQYLGIWK